MPVGGALIVDKPCGLTSHDVVARVRRCSGLKVGHTGTLDPAASGVLPLLLGRATRLMQFYSQVDKEYNAELRLGLTTNTYDLDGEVQSRRAVPSLNAEAINRLLDHFRGKIIQEVPPFSAIKVGGKRLYQLARKGVAIELPSREVEISEIELLEASDETWRLRIRCSSGTYIRSLAHDIGQRLGCGAALAALRRTRSGEFALRDSLSLEKAELEWQDHLISPGRLLTHLPAVEVSPEQARSLIHGQTALCQKDEPTVRILFQDRLIGIASCENSILRPRVILLRPNEI